MNCPIVQSLLHSFLPSPGKEGPLRALSFQRLLLRNSPACYHAVSARSWRPVFFLWPLWDSLPQNLALMLRQVSFPVKSSQFLRRGWPPLPLVPLLLSSGLGVQPGPSSSWPPYPALWQAEGWQCLSPHVYSTLTEGDKAAPMGLNWSCQGGQRSDGYHRTPSCLSPVKNKACLPGLCWAPSSSL